MWETWVQSLGRENPLEKEMATHSSILAWRISWMEEPAGLQSVGCKELDMLKQLSMYALLLLFHFHALEREMATHSSTLAWRVLGMGEPGWLPSMGSHRVGHD